MGKFFNWPPFVAVALDADTGKPLDPNIGMRVYREFYDVKKNSNGKKVMVAHKSGSAAGSKAAEEAKKNGNGNGNGKGNGKGGDSEEKKNDGGGGEEKVHVLTYSCFTSLSVVCLTDQHRSRRIATRHGRTRKTRSSRR